MRAKVGIANLRSQAEGAGSNGDREAVKRFLQAAAGSALSAAELEAAFRFINHGDVPDIADRNSVDETYAPWLSEIASVKRAIQAGGAERRRIALARDADRLAGVSDLWSLKKALAWLAMQAIQPDRDFAVVAMACNEGINILEWLAFHRAVGVEHVFLYTNDNHDGSVPLMRSLADASELTLIENEVDDRACTQVKVYEHAVYCLPELRRYRWVAFIDLDEFIKPNGPSIDLRTLIADAEQAVVNASAIFLHWRWFGSSGKVRLTDEPVLTRFTRSRADTHGKSICRLSDVISMRLVHHPVLTTGRILIDSDFRPLSDTPRGAPHYGRAQINHYWNKSFEEFILKRERDLGVERSYTQFFQWDGVGEIDETVDARLLDPTRAIYDQLLRIPGVEDQLQDVRTASREMIDRLKGADAIDDLYARERKAAGR